MKDFLELDFKITVVRERIKSLTQHGLVFKLVGIAAKY
jgi:hypothetical protein